MTTVYTVVLHVGVFLHAWDPACMDCICSWSGLWRFKNFVLFFPLPNHQKLMHLVTRNKKSKMTGRRRIEGIYLVLSRQHFKVSVCIWAKISFSGEVGLLDHRFPIPLARRSFLLEWHVYYHDVFFLFLFGSFSLQFTKKRPLCNAVQ